MSLYKTFRTNTPMEIGGRWFEINPPNDDGTKPGFLLARRSSKNTKFAGAMERVVRTNRRELDNGTMSPEESRRIIVETFVDTCLKDWRNVYDDAEKPLSFSKTNAMALFDDLPDLFDTLNEQAGLLTNYQDKMIALAAGN
jgi:hypothetical protein